MKSTPSLRTTHLRAHLSALLLIAASACGLESPPGLEESRDEILNGSPISGDIYNAVVSVNIGSDCSGVFVHPRYVLTAAHCAPACSNTSQTGCQLTAPLFGTIGVDGAPPVSAEIWDGPDAHNGNRYVADAIYFAPGFNAQDVALLHLRGTTQSMVGIARVMHDWHDLTSSTLSNWANTNGVLVGFSPNGNSANAPLRRQGAATITGGTNNGRIVTNGVVQVCRGDSGGPMFASERITGEWLVGGIISARRGSGDCPAQGSSTANRSYMAFIPRSFLDGRAQADGECGTTTWDDCVAKFQYGTCLSDSDCPSSTYCDAAGVCFNSYLAFQSFNMLRTLTYPGINGAWTRISEASTPFNLREDHFVSVLLQSWFSGASSATSMALDYRLLIDGVAVWREDSATTGGYVNIDGNTIYVTRGTHTLDLEVRTQLISGPPVNTTLSGAYDSAGYTTMIITAE